VSRRSHARLDDVDVEGRSPRDYLGRAGSALRRLFRDGPVELLRHAHRMLRLRAQQRLYRRQPERRGPRPDDIRIDRPVFIVGVPGGGGTILVRTLFRHPRVVYGTGNSRYWAADGEMHTCRHLVDLPEPLVLRSAHFHNVTEEMEKHPVYGYQRSPLYAIDEFLPRYRKTAADLDPEVTGRFRRVIQKIILAYADDPSKARFVDMSQLFTVQIPYVAGMLEDTDPHFLLLTRNPYVWCRRTVFKDLSRKGTAVELTREQRIRCAVEAWHNSYRLALESQGSQKMLLVRSEDFVADPESVVRRIGARAAAWL